MKSKKQSNNHQSSNNMVVDRLKVKLRTPESHWTTITRDIKAAAYAAPWAIGVPYPANNLALHYMTSDKPFFPKGYNVFTQPYKSIRLIYKNLFSNAIGGIVSKVGYLAPYYIINDLAKGTGYETPAYCASLVASGVTQSAVTYHVRMDQITVSVVSKMDPKDIPKNHFSQCSTINRYLYYSSWKVFSRAYPRWLFCYEVANSATIASIDFMRGQLRKQYPDWSDEKITLVGSLIAVPPLQFGLMISNTFAARGMAKVLFKNSIVNGARGALSLILLSTMVQKTGEASIAFVVGDRQKKKWEKPEEESRYQLIS